MKNNINARSLILLAVAILSQLNACAIVRAYRGTFLLEDLEFNGIPVHKYISESGKSAQ